MKELALLFLKLGTTAFGGPAAHIAMMEDEVVNRRQWISHEQFLDLLGATNIIPGPNSTEMAIHIGYVRAGWKGLLLAGICFVLPAVLLTLLLAKVYQAYGSVPQLGSLIVGIRSAVIAVIAAAVFRLAKPILKNRFMLATGCLVIVLNLLGVGEILLLFAAGIAGIIWTSLNQSRNRAVLPALLAPFLVLQSTGPALAATADGATLTTLGLFFLKIGSILYGSGYVLVAFLQSGLVESRHWITQTQLLDAIAIGQFTPGPVLSTATFIGFLMFGIPGAAVATTGIFLPSFVFVLVSGPFIPRLRKSPLASGFLDGVNAASFGLMIAVTMLLASSTLTHATSWIVFLLAGGALLIWNLNAAWIVLGSAVLGWLISVVS